MFVVNNGCGSIDHVSVRAVSCEDPIARLKDGFPLRS